jgi:hypothetical protein
MCHKKQIIQDMFEDTNGLIKSRKSKNRKCNGQQNNEKRTNNDLQNS